MKRTLRAILGVVFIGIIVFSAISICQHTGRGLRADVTERALYTLSGGTRAILSKVNQPLTLKLYYTKTAAMKAPDQIRYFNNYAEFVRSLLAEYSRAAGRLVKLEVIDPRPFSDEEADALRYGLKRIALSEEESFFFGLVLQTQFGVSKSIPFFSPSRQNFVEYDISSLIDNAICREKKNIGVVSGLGVMGDDTSGYMAQMMRMQGQEPKGPWTIVNHLKQKYNVRQIDSKAEEIKDVDILLVIHPKDLPEQTLFAIDQFVLKGRRAIVCVDPYCVSDQPKQPRQMMSGGHKSSSNLTPLLKQWGLQMPENTFAGDRDLALAAALHSGARPQKIIGFLGLNEGCFNKDRAISAELNQVRLLFAGVLRETEVAEADEVKLERTPLVGTTSRGNSWSVSSPFELMMPDAERLMNKFTSGVEPVYMGYLVTGRFKSAFPEGVQVKDEDDPNSKPRHLTGLVQAETDCAVAVFSDVDFLTDMLAYQSSFFGTVPVGDNATLLLNCVDQLGGSGDLISIRSRGSFTRPFTKVDEIEAEAAKGTLVEEKRISAEISGFKEELNKVLASAKEGQEEVIGGSILREKKDLELKIHQARMRLRDLKMQKRERIERLGVLVRNLNTLPGPLLVLLIAVVLGFYRSSRRRYYISRASDA